MNGRSNLKSAPHCALKNLRTFWVLRYDTVIGVFRVMGSLCQSKLIVPNPAVQAASVARIEVPHFKLVQHQ